MKEFKLFIGIPALDFSQKNKLQTRVADHAKKNSDVTCILSNHKVKPVVTDCGDYLPNVVECDQLNPGMLYIRYALMKWFLSTNCTHFMMVDSDDKHTYRYSNLKKIVAQFDSGYDANYFIKLNYKYYSARLDKTTLIYLDDGTWGLRTADIPRIPYTNGTDLTIMDRTLVQNCVYVLESTFGNKIPYLRVAEDALLTMIMLNVANYQHISKYVAGEYLSSNSVSHVGTNLTELTTQLEGSVRDAFERYIPLINTRVPVDYLNLIKYKSYEFIYAKLRAAYHVKYPDLTHKREVRKRIPLCM